jgi:hypothetical protein
LLHESLGCAAVVFVATACDQVPEDVEALKAALIETRAQLSGGIRPLGAALRAAVNRAFYLASMQ